MNTPLHAVANVEERLGGAFGETDLSDHFLIFKRMWAGQTSNDTGAAAPLRCLPMAG